MNMMNSKIYNCGTMKSYSEGDILEATPALLKDQQTLMRELSEQRDELILDEKSMLEVRQGAAKLRSHSSLETVKLAQLKMAINRKKQASKVYRWSHHIPCVRRRRERHIQHQLARTKEAESDAESAEYAHRKAQLQFYKQEVAVLRIFSHLFYGSEGCITWICGEPPIVSVLSRGVAAAAADSRLD